MNASSVVGAVLLDPLLDVLRCPHLAHPQLVDGRGEVRARGELVDALAAESAQAFAA